MIKSHLGTQILYEINACADVILAAVFAKRMLLMFHQLSLIPNSLNQIRKLGRNLTAALMFGFLCFCVTTFTWIITSWDRVLYLPTPDAKGVFPTPAYSHQLNARPILLELQARGHEIVVITTAPLKENAPFNYKEIDICFLHDHVNLTEFTVDSNNEWRTSFFYKIQTGIEKMVERIYTMHEVQELIRSEQHFDLVLIEWCAHPSLTAFSERFNCPMIGIRSLGLRVEAHDIVGNPVTPSYIPVAYQQYHTDFYGRFVNTMIVMYMRYFHKFVTLPSADRIAKRYFPNHTTYVGDLEQQVSLMLINTHPVLTGPRPYVPSVIEVGGLQLENTPSDMPEDIKKYLDGAKNGAILFSLGTLISNRDMSNKTIDTLLEAFSELPYRVIWKSGKQLFTIGPDNIRVYKWLPQAAILKHPNTRLFVTHGGLSSIWESIMSGIPMIVVPFHSDQFHNARRIEYLGIGLHFDIRTISKETFTRYVNEIMTNSSYTAQTTYVAKLLKDQPMSPLEKAIWWIEYVLRYGGTPYFKSEAVGMPWYIYFSLDIIIGLLLMCLITITIVLKIIRIFYKLKCRRSKLKNN
ncbi:UDP-glycosyltransferase family 35 member E2 [Carabus blaptoides fortunei]